jgi:hypothetical protein
VLYEKLTGNAIRIFTFVHRELIPEKLAQSLSDDVQRYCAPFASDQSTGEVHVLVRVFEHHQTEGQRPTPWPCRSASVPLEKLSA